MVAAIGSFIALVIFLILAILSLLLKKKQEREDPPVWRPPGQPPPPPARSWEEELRRVLQENVLQPPVVPPPPPRPAARRIPPPIPVVETEGHSDEGGFQFVPPANFEPAFQPTPRCVDSQERYAGAAQLPQRVAQHMADVTRHRVGTTSAHRAEVPAATLAAARSFRTRSGARAAIIASIILGPPRALEG